MLYMADRGVVSCGNWVPKGSTLTSSRQPVPEHRALCAQAQQQHRVACLRTKRMKGAPRSRYASCHRPPVLAVGHYDRWCVSDLGIIFIFEGWVVAKMLVCGFRQGTARGLWRNWRRSKLPSGIRRWRYCTSYCRGFLVAINPCRVLLHPAEKSEKGLKNKK